MREQSLSDSILIRLTGEEIGRLFMPRAATFEVLQSSVVQEQFVVDALLAQSERGHCRLTFSEWEEDAPNGREKVWVAEYAIELAIGGIVAYGTYSTTFSPEQRELGLVLDNLKRVAEDDFMLCAKLIGRSVRRDLVIDQEVSNERVDPGAKVH